LHHPAVILSRSQVKPDVQLFTAPQAVDCSCKRQEPPINCCCC
jgi:hypothetical protein